MVHPFCSTLALTLAEKCLRPLSALGVPPGVLGAPAMPPVALPVVVLLVVGRGVFGRDGVNRAMPGPSAGATAILPGVLGVCLVWCMLVYTNVTIANSTAWDWQ